MYVIKINEDNTLVATQKERIMKRSKLVDNLVFLVRPEYKGYDMSDSTVVMEYILPISRMYKTVTLVKSEDMYNGFLKYTIPFDTDLTSEAGEIEFKLTFALADIDADGNKIQRVRKTDAGTIQIIPTSAWSDIIPDSALSALDQRLIKQDAQMKELREISEVLSDTKADNLRYNTSNGELQLVAGSKAIGNKVTIVSCNGGDPGDPGEGWPVVEF